MNTLFPFGFPSATAFYLSVYVLALVIHVVFMNYVFAGTAYLAAVSLFTGGPQRRRQKSPLALVLRDWMPFALGAAITAGVAPLFFLQILYPKQFYTANLLLFHRWMAVVPVLIIGFYLLYVLKSRIIGGWPAWLRAAVGFGAFACIAFTGYSWTENHLLSLDERIWSSFYGQDRLVYWHPALLPRAGMWLIGAIPTMLTLAGWQLWSAQQRGRQLPTGEYLNLAPLALAGLILSAVCGVVYYLLSDDSVRAQVSGPLAGPYLFVAMGGALLQSIAWLWQWKQPRFSGGALLATSIGGLATILGMTVVRESVRLAEVDVTVLYQQHAQAAHKGGVGVFVACLALNFFLIGWCIAAVRQHLRPDTRAPARLR